jgi:DNA gyrase subunit B
MTKIGAGGKFDKIHKVSGGLHGVGVSVVNALSNHLRATVHSSDGKVYEQEKKRKVYIPLKTIGKLQKRYYRYFYPDSSILHKRLIFSYDTLSARMRELS